MASKSESWWHRHPVVTGITGSVLASGVLTGAQLLGLIDLNAVWSNFIASLATAKQWLFTTGSMPHWLIVVLALAGLLGFVILGVIGVSLLRSNKDEVEARTALSNYTQDEFFGMVWRWSWTSDFGARNFVPFCKHCDMQIDPNRGGGYVAVAPLVYQCSMCGEVQYQCDWNIEHSDVERQVLLLLQQRVRRNFAHLINKRSQ